MRNGNDSDQGLKAIDGSKLCDMIKLATRLLEKKKSIINSLNVFPVPDGDTGTNMHLTTKEALKEIEDNNSHHAGEICQSLSRGALMGARGNSGVILSQLLRGFAQANKDKRLITAQGLVEGLEEASRVAYKGVLKPVEGTILTVSRKAAEGAREAYEESDDLLEILQATIETADIALNKTPEQLPVLKEADVVDAGGQGLVFIFEGMLKSLQGETIGPEIETAEKTPEQERKQQEKLEYNYCTQLLVDMEKENGRHEIEQIRSELNNYGDSLMVVGSDNIIKIHIHTNPPGVILEYALKLGMLQDINIDNMILQSESHGELVEMNPVEEKTASGMSLETSPENSDETSPENTDFEENISQKKSEWKKRGIIAVAAGEGIREILKQLGVDEVIHGGQSMNPSTNDFLSALEEVPAREVIIFPNNKNIISSARQAADLCEDKTLEVISTKSFTEAIASLMLYNLEVDLEELAEKMEDEIESVTTIEITRAVKDSNVKDLSIEEGEVIGLVDGDIMAKGNNYDDVVVEIVERIHDDEDLITIYYGEVLEEDQAVELRDRILNHFQDIRLEVELYEGRQPLYPYIVSLEK